MRIKIKEIFSTPEKYIGKEITVCGWVKTVREQKSHTFIEISDGSIFSNLQAILTSSEKLGTGYAVSATGKIVKSPAKEQSVEMQIGSLKIFGTCDQERYPLQKKRHSLEFLRTIAHLRPRTNTQGAVTRLRSEVSYQTHKFFHDRGFFYIHTPIITGSDCEGAGALFRVTTLPPKEEDFKKDFFGKQTFLTVSGQLNLEAFACSLSDVYSFGPTFRAEKSNTSRHLAEFWMIEPEIAFADIKDLMEISKDYIQFLIAAILKNCKEDILFFDKFISPGLMERLTQTLESGVATITYTEAIDILLKSKEKFEFPVKWGLDLQSEHERYITEKHFKSLVIVRDYPKEIKAFYMRENEDGKTVAAMDILAPGVGEIIGGSQREERLEIIEKKMEKLNLKKEDYWWWLELRKFGTVPHCGFGMGLERFLFFVTGLENIRDLIPFPRATGQADF